MIHLIGPGAAGKTTIGALLARRLGVGFVDLDQAFCAREGDISQYLGRHGYDAYAGRNVEIYFAVAATMGDADVLALSSGFMAYRPDVHSDYEAYRNDIASSATTFVLLPSLDLETCVDETVRRQRLRPFARSAEREADVIRARFPKYASLPAKKVATMRLVGEVLDDIVTALDAIASPWPGLAATSPGCE